MQDMVRSQFKTAEDAPATKKGSKESKAGATAEKQDDEM